MLLCAIKQVEFITMKCVWYGLSILVLSALWTGCQSYSPKPLDPLEIFREV